MSDDDVIAVTFFLLAFALFVALLATDRYLRRPWWYKYIPIIGIIVCAVGLILEVWR